MDDKPFRILFVYPNLMLQTTFPMAISIFSSILKGHGYQTDIFDTTFYETEEATSDERRVENLQIARFQLGEEFKNLPSTERMHQDLRAKIESWRPQLIAVSILEDVYPLALDLLDTTSAYKIPTIVGGLFPTFAPEKLIAHPGVDFVCIGEGEEALPELCQCLERGQNPSGIRNLWIKQGELVVKNDMRPPRDISKNPPPDFALFDERRFVKPMKGRLYRMGLVETNRGCPYTCSFCNSYAQSRLYKEETGLAYFRRRDIGVIHDELKLLKERNNIEFIYFPAEVFLAMTPDYLREFHKMYMKFRIPFFCQNRAEVITEETVRMLVDMNCHSCAIGIEHGNEEFRFQRLNRKVKNETYVNACRLLEQTPIKVSVNNIIGFPDETRELVFDTIDLNKRLNVYQINAYYFTPYYGTMLRDYCVDKGFISKDSLTTYITKDSVLRMESLSHEEIRGLVRTFTLYVRLPEDRYPEIAVAERFDEEGNAMFKKLQQEFWERYLH